MTSEQASERSHLVRLFQAAISDSAIVRMMRWPVARLPILGRDVQSASVIRDDRAVVTVLDESRIVHVGFALIAGLERAWRHSRSARMGASLLQRVSPLMAAQRVRLTALALLTAVATHVVMTRFSAPEPTAIVRVIWMVILVLLGAVIAAAGHIAAAWRDWSTRVSRNERDIA